MILCKIADLLWWVWRIFFHNTMASSQDSRHNHCEIYSDIDSEFSDSQSLIINGEHSRKSSDSNFDTENGDTEFYEVPMPRSQAPEVYSASGYKSYTPSRYVSQVYISQGLSHRSKRHIRDSREHDLIPQTTRNLLEVICLSPIFLV